MTNEQRESVERLRKGIDDILFATLYSQEEMNTDIDTVLSLIKEQSAELLQKNAEIEKKDKQIDLMSRAIDNYDSQLEINTFKDKEDIKQYFADLVEKE